MQWTERVERIADKNPPQWAPPPHEFRLQNAAVYHLLIETPEEVREENCPHTPQEVKELPPTKEEGK